MGLADFDREPLSELFGIRLSGRSVTGFGSDDEEDLRELLHQQQVLAFRGQALDAADLINFGQLFGELQLHVLQQYTLPGHPEIFVLSNEVVNGREIGRRNGGFTFHTDFSYMRRATAYTILYCLKTPSTGGDTLFASTYAAYDKLSAARQEELQKLQVIFSYASLYKASGNATPLTPEQIARTPVVTHPMVRTHPYTGRQGLYLGSEEVAGVEGMEGESATGLMRELMTLTIAPEGVLSYKWSSGDLVIWDNRGLLHSASRYDKDREIRTIYRLSIEGEEPR